MKRFVGVAMGLIVMSGQAGAAPVAARAARIMSLKVCTDELLMDLVPPSFDGRGRIASISYLSREKAALALWPEAARLPVNHNSPEEVLAVKPDLVLTDRFTQPAMRDALARSGAQVVEVPEAQSFADIRAVVRMLGMTLGEPARAEGLIAQMDATLAGIDKPVHPMRVAAWGNGGFVPGRDGLFNAVLEAAGGTNIAQGAGRYYDVESLIAARPDVLAYGDDYLDEPSLRADQNDHPALARLFGDRKITYPSALLACGVPQTADAAAELHDALAAAMRAPGGIPGDADPKTKGVPWDADHKTRGVP